MVYRHLLFTAALIFGVLLITTCTKRVVEPKLMVVTIQEIHVSSPSIGQVFFVDSQNGLLEGGDRILRTTNGGESWASVFVYDTAGYFTDIEFPNKDTAYVFIHRSATPVGEKVFRSTDGGVNWSYLTTVPSAKAFSFYNGKNGKAFAIIPPATTLQLVTTSNAGQTWSHTTGNMPPNTPARMTFIDQNTGFVQCTNYGFNTFDGGLTWNNVGACNYQFIMKLLPSGSTFRCDHDYNIYKSGDFGTSWKKVFANPNNNAWISTVDFNQGGLCCGIYFESLMISKDYGETWLPPTEIVEKESEKQLRDMDINFLAVLDDHTIIVTGWDHANYGYRMLKITVQ